METTVLAILRLMAVALGGTALGLTIGIFVLYFRKATKTKLTLLNLHIVTVAAAHCLLIMATMITMWRGVYKDINTFWYWLTFTGWVLSLFSLGIIFHKIKSEGASHLNSDRGGSLDPGRGDRDSIRRPS